ncbi:uncharacterized protein [Dermacentor albipictus]|uniref:uncharacterized protein n=1 Tax=Dermacentor albipictus TaxID=60249 RepID=UPI0031FBEE4A
MGDKKTLDLPVYTFLAAAWKELASGQQVSAPIAASTFKSVITPDLYISKGHYAYHDIDHILPRCRLLPATYLQPPQLDGKEQEMYSFGLSSATKHVADLDKLRGQGVGVATLSVSVGLYGRWHFVDQDQGTDAESHRPGSLCLPTKDYHQKAGIYEVCNNPQYRIVDDEKFHCKFTANASLLKLKIFVFDTTETLRYKVTHKIYPRGCCITGDSGTASRDIGKVLCSAKQNATNVKYGITAARLEFADSSGQCKNGTFPLLRALKQIVKFFSDSYKSEADFDKCVALKT